jgi:C_GCAxxG_C_C family probable redox protein
METNVNKTLQQFRDGLNCAQSVLIAYEEEFRLDRNLALSVACGFGGGMGRLQETCGAVTGAFMVLGIFNCRKYADNDDRKEHTYAAIQAFNKRFIARNKTTNCAKLLNCDLKTREGRMFAKENRLFDTICEKCISDALSILSELTENE